MTDPAKLARQLAALRTSYIEQLPGKLDALHDGLQALLQGRWDAETVQTAYRQAHSLAGSGATFGFEALSHTARDLEQQLKIAASSATVPDPAWRERVANALQALTRAGHDALGAAGQPTRVVTRDADEASCARPAGAADPATDSEH